MTKIGILASGKGSNMLAIIDACNNGTLNARIEIVISNNSDSGALKTAREKKIRTRHISARLYPDSETLDQTLTDALIEVGIDLVILAGYMKKVGPVLLEQFRGRIINIHPSLLPKFGGKGMYGLNIHQAVIDADESESGATVHVVDADYDQGKILTQQKVGVDSNDTANSLADKVLEIEHKLYPETINKILLGKIRLPCTDL